MFLELVVFLFIVSILMQISYWFFYLLYLDSKSFSKTNNQFLDQPISIVICVKNESENILACSNSWISQLETHDELILVDDFSNDDSKEQIIKLVDLHPNVVYLKTSEDLPGKKLALMEALKSAKNPYILVTDADCKPKPTWKKTMLSKLETNTEFVLGFGPFYKEDTFINVFQRFEGLLTAIQYYAYAASGNPYMGVGRNMLFKKSVFDANVYKNSNLASGDDDLLVSAKATNENVKLSIDPESFVHSNAKSTILEYLKQKSRHVSSSVEYKPKIKFLLMLFSSTQLLSNLLFLVLVFTSVWKMCILLFVLKQSVILIGLSKSGVIFKEKDLIVYSPILDLCLSIYYLLLIIIYPLTNKKSWN